MAQAIEKALHKKPQSHPREWVDLFRSVLPSDTQRRSNPTNGSWWIVQIQPSLLESGWQDLKHPPTAVGGIQEFRS
jgi:hypothetical protein